MSSKILAVHLTDRRLTTAVAESTIGSFKLTEVEDRDAPGAEDRLSLVEGRGFDRVIASFPGELAAFRFLELPFSDRRRIAKAAGPALEEYVPLSLDDAVTAHDQCSKTAGGSVLAAMARRTAIDDHLARLARLGVHPESLVWAPTATLACYLSDPDAASAGDETPWLAVDVGRDGVVIGAYVDRQLKDLRLLPAAEETTLVRKLAGAIRTVSGEKCRVVLGGHASDSFVKALKERLDGYQISLLSPHCALAGGDRTLWRSATPAVGLLYGADGRAPMPRLDFRRNEPSLLGVGGEVADELRPLLPWAATAAVFLLIAGGVDYARLARTADKLSAKNSALYTAAMDAPASGGGQRLKMEMRVSELKNRLDRNDSGAQGSAIGVLAELSRSVPKNLEVEIYQLLHSPPSVSLAGRGASFETVTRLEESLRGSKSFESVEVRDVHASVSGEGVDFQVVITMGGDST